MFTSAPRDTTSQLQQRRTRLYQIWLRPDDLPELRERARGRGDYVVRAVTALMADVVPDPEEDAVLCESLGEAREVVPTGLVWMARHPTDPPSIVEVWGPWYR